MTRNHPRLLLFTFRSSCGPQQQGREQLEFLQLVRDALRGLRNQKSRLCVSSRVRNKCSPLPPKTSHSSRLSQRLSSREEPVPGVFSITGLITVHVKTSPWTPTNRPFDLWGSQKDQGFELLRRGGSGYEFLLCCWKKIFYTLVSFTFNLFSFFLPPHYYANE